MSKFELWLDESGDFERDSLGKDSPSLVGGVLVPQNTLDERKAQRILDGKPIHSTEIRGSEYGEKALPVLQKIVDSGGSLVIFENKERLEIVDGDTTYLNILAEGVMQLFQQLMTEYQDVHIDIYAANRRSMAKDSRDFLITDREYTKRLEEKISLITARKSLKKEHFSWTFRRGSANRDFRLMLGDVVCHSWFRKASRKFNSKQKSQLAQLYQPKYIFSVIEHSTLSSIKDAIIEGDLGKALFEIITSDEYIRFKDRFFDTIFNHLKSYNYETRKIQLLDITNKVKTLISIDRDLSRSKRILMRIEEDVLPEMRIRNIGVDTFAFDIYFLMLTVATHQGDIIGAGEIIDKCQKALLEIDEMWNRVSYYFDYSIRKGIHLMNIYDYQGVISAMNRLENLLDETLGLFELADGLNEICDSVQSNAKGKVMGTRLQAYTFLGRTDPKNLEKARADSDLAIKEFTADSDKKRQYQYRCQIENEAENYKEALLWLGKSFDILGNTADMDKFLNDLAASIYDSNTSDFSFGAMHFTNIMAETALHGKNDLASSLYNAWTKAQLEKHPILLTEAKQHPFQIIYRNLGRTLTHLGSEKAALEKYDKAFEICLENRHNLTLYSIGLGILAEKVAMLYRFGNSKEANRQMQSLKRTYARFMEERLPSEMKEYFRYWEQVNISENLDDEQCGRLLLRLARQIPY